MTAHAASAPRGRAPWYVPLFTPITRFLLAAGVPLGFNGLLTVPGRKSGVPRTTPLAVITLGDRHWVWSPWGEVQWVRNLRAAGHAVVTVRRTADSVCATELDAAQRVAFFRDVLGPLARSVAGGVTFIRLVDGVDLEDPVGAAEGRAVFELQRCP